MESVAETFSVEVPRLGKPLIGELDMVVTDGADRCIVDFKNSASKRPQGKADLSLRPGRIRLCVQEDSQDYIAPI